MPVVAAFADAHVLVVLALGVLGKRAALAGEVGTGAFGTPLVRMVVERLSEMGIVIHDAGAAIAQDVGREGADHLGMAQIATFGDVDIAPGEFERGVDFLQAALDVFLAVHDDGRDDLHRTADGRRHKHQHREGQVIVNDALVPLGPPVVGSPEGEDRFDGDEHRQHQRRLVRVWRQEKPQQRTADAEEDVGERVVEEGFGPGHAILALGFKHGDFHGFIVRAARACGFPHVDCQQDKAEQIQEATDHPEDVEELDVLQGLQEAVFEGGSVGLELAQREALGNAREPHRHHIQQHADQADPEVHVGHRLGPQLGFPQAWCEPVKHAGRHEPVPA